MSLRLRIGVTLLFAIGLACIAALVTAMASGEPVATASARACNIQGEQRDLGASYVTSLKVSHTTCRKGKKVIKAFHQCRFDAGGANGKCRQKVLDWNCGEHRFAAVPNVQYNSRVKCTRGARVIKSTYTQNT